MKKIIAAALAAVMLSAFTGCGNTAGEKGNETYIYGQIESVSGNDIVLLLAEYNEGEETGAESGSVEKSGEGSEESSGSSDGKKSKRPGRPDGGEMPEGFDPSSFSGEMPEGFDPSQFGGELPEGFDPSQFGGERPSMQGKSDKDKSEKSEDGENSEKSQKSESTDSGESSRKREKPEGFTKPENGELPENFDPSQFGGELPEGFDPSKFSGERPERSDKSGSGESSGEKGSGRKPGSGKTSSKYTLTGEQEELRIPVGTTVTTSLGVETDFEVLSAGDIIRCSIEKNSDGEDVIVAVQIMEQ